MRTALLVAGLLLATALTGCIGTDGPDAPEASTTDADTGLPTGAPTDGTPARGLDTAPTLHLGEWWNVTMTSQLDGSTHEAQLVVAGADDGSYLIGMPTDRFVHEALILHLPGLGLVDRGTFGYEAHDTTFEPVRFPLEPGESWETAWYTGPLDAEVASVEEDAARVSLVGDNTHINVTYEPGLGLPSNVEVDGYGSYEVTDHGYGYEGNVTVPANRDLVILNGRIAAALDTTLTPAPPVESVEIEGDHDRVTGALVLGNLLVDGTPGVYRAAATAPDGTTYASTYTTTGQDAGVSITPFVQEDPVGTWELEYEAAGPGVAAVEAVAYDVVQVDLQAS